MPLRLPGIRSAVRAVRDGDDPAVEQALALCNELPYHTTSVRAVLQGAQRSRCLPGTLYLAPDPDPRAFALCGASITVLGDDLEPLLPVVRRAARRCSSLVGPAEVMARLWPQVRPSFPPARSVRLHQPVLVWPGEAMDTAVTPLSGPLQVAQLADTPAVVAAAVAMYTEEMGYDPRRFGQGYERHIAALVRQGRVYMWRDYEVPGHPVIFTANIGAVAPPSAEIHGVYTAPAYRGQGIATRAMAAIVEHIRSLWNLTPVLYVNDFNRAARRCYQRVGFTSVGELATVIF